MTKTKKDGNTYQLLSDEKSNPKRKVNKTQQKKANYSINPEITNEFQIQHDLRTIGIYDHEWDALHDNVKNIKNECSKFNIGPFLDGFGSAISIPLIINFFKVVDLKANVPEEIISECYIYGILLVIYIISLTVRKMFKPKWLTSYTRFDSDIKHLDDRMNEIEKRIGIYKKEE